jgi:hypothetical protein
MMAKDNLSVLEGICVRFQSRRTCRSVLRSSCSSSSSSSI